ncbi:MAG: MaoC family dehydratase N-terminal domain-containing protein [Candidatus Freyarchaeota archaeon]|nr:MaoC family dehydratase N-terminal domain-containing protein [Candidatus Jordarchaeia archaeon]MBS7269987.1 MaoC family dehydratase N-terminal domain-containing protein [Candidatus Jordarchaeia archaeon]MBS7281240.1 MaoC family dehydratase N-terminal domain-containing protein [Candidatus Jordarchaeia archaeon]
MSYSGKTFPEFKVGDKLVSPSITVTESHITLFAGLSGDFNPLHTNEEFAQKMPFKGRIAHGMLTVSMESGFIGMLLAGTAIAFLEAEYKFKAPVKINDTIHTELEVAETKPVQKYDGGIVKFNMQIKNQRGETVVEGYATVMVSNKRPS